ncbi:MAG: hypothetical protein IPK76_14225 [Lewinellaceae bacterium]|jgi:hypothetical protein|nr:hypothetical protein [Lewinellaceae bacterium]
MRNDKSWKVYGIVATELLLLSAGLGYAFWSTSRDLEGRESNRSSKSP